MYISRSGEIRLINHWDINNDGYMDLLISQDHNAFETIDAFIYWGKKEGYQSLFPDFWKKLPAYKIFKDLNERQKHIGFLPSFGGGPARIADLNRDGFLDIIFVNMIHNHTHKLDAYIYWGGPNGYSIVQRSEIPTIFALDVELSDLNRDGYLDLIFANMGYEHGFNRGYRDHLESYIYWGGPEMFSTERRNPIGTVSAMSCTAGDFNGDKWPDLAFVNSLPEPGVYIYLSDKGSFSPDKRLEIPGDNPRVVRSGDVNKDGIDDLIVCSGDKGAKLYFGGSPFHLDNAVSLPVEKAQDVAMSDLNDDGNVDLVFASRTIDSDKSLSSAPDLKGGSGSKIFSEMVLSSELREATTLSEIYWGSGSGFDAGHRLLLPTIWPKAVELADLNGDGYDDIVFGNYGHGNNYDVPSYIYWGSDNGFEASHRTHLQGFGVSGIAIDDLDRNGRPDILLVNQMSETSPIPSVIYWGNPAHFYSANNVSLVHSRKPYYSKIVDLNSDGYNDLVFGGYVTIDWGSAEGFTKHTEFDIWSFGVEVGDFNNDGYLDLAFLMRSKEGAYCLLVWGSSEMFSLENATRFPLKATRACCGLTKADLNRDGYLDLIFPSGETPEQVSEIAWGSPNGFGRVTSDLLKTNSVGAPTIADLDGNGWLDLIFPGTLDRNTLNHHTKTLLYWGSKNGYSDSRRIELEAYGTMEIRVADLNLDGFLDIACSNYQANDTRSLPIFIYWGNAENKYGNQNRTELPGESPGGLQVLDLNGDDYPEIIVHNHIKYGDHNLYAYIYWGNPDGYSIERRTLLPTMGPHYAQGVDPGNIYNRGPSFDYISTAVSVPRDATTLELKWEGETPYKTEINFEIRTSFRESGMVEENWSPIIPGKSFSLPVRSKFLQYRAILISPDGGSSPVLREVVLSFD